MAIVITLQRTPFQEQHGLVASPNHISRLFDLYIKTIRPSCYQLLNSITANDKVMF